MARRAIPTTGKSSFPFGVGQGPKRRAANDLKRSDANKAAAGRRLVKLPTWGRVAAVSRTLRGSKCLVMAKAGRAAPHAQLPATERHNKLATFALRDPGAQKLKGFITDTQLFRSAAAVLRCSTGSSGVAPIPARCLKMTQERQALMSGLATSERPLR